MVEDAKNAKLQTVVRLFPGWSAAISFVFAVAILSVVATLQSIINWNSSAVTIMWPTNGLVLGVLLCAPRRQWWAYLATSFGVELAVNLLLSHGMQMPIYLGVCNAAEVLIAALLLCRTICPKPDLTQPKQLLSLLFYGVLLAPMVSTMLILLYRGAPAFRGIGAIQNWFVADALGIGLITPLYLSFRSFRRTRRAFAGRSWIEVTSLLLMVCGIATLVFSNGGFTFLFLVLPCLLCLGMRLRLAGSTIGLLLVAMIGGIFTSTSGGMLVVTQGSSISSRAFVLQFFVAVAMLLLYAVEVIIAESSRLQTSLKASETRFRLLAEASRDVIVLMDLEGSRQYVSPAVSELMGWGPEELIGGNYRQMVHPDDIPSFDEMFRECRAGRRSNTLSYRCRRKDGGYLWMEANLRLHTDPVTGEPGGFVNVVRDIASRKVAEDELTQAFHAAEFLATIDGLTGLANRRRLDETMEREWRRAMRDGKPLSILMLDVDHFKRYNDLYGHLEGDRCLREVAECARSIIHRSSDLLARYGGEEFVAVLPNTDSAGAYRIAEQIRTAVRDCRIVHAGNSHGMVTISIGCATNLVERDTRADVLFAAADHALYQAKASGRNRTEISNGMILRGS